MSANFSLCLSVILELLLTNVGMPEKKKPNKVDCIDLVSPLMVPINVNMDDFLSLHAHTRWPTCINVCCVGAHGSVSMEKTSSYVGHWLFGCRWWNWSCKILFWQYLMLYWHLELQAQVIKSPKCCWRL